MRNMICIRPAAFVCSFFIFFGVLSAIFTVFIDSMYFTYALLLLSALLSVASLPLFLAARCNDEGAYFCRIIAVSLIFAAIGGCLSGYFYGIRPRAVISEYCGDDRQIGFIVEESKHYSSYSAVYYIKITKIDGSDVSLRAVLSCDGERDLSVGECGKAKGNISEVELYGDTFLSKLFYLSEGRYLNVDIGDNAVTDRTDSTSVTASFSRIRTSLSADISVRLGREEGGLVSALLLGERSGLSNRISSDYKLLGISHIIAISGMHFSIIISVLDVLLKKLCRHQRARVILVTVIALLYAALTGFSASVLRSAVMLVCAKSAPFFGRRGDVITSLFVSVFAIMFVSPYAMTDIGLLLSFAATLGVVTLGAKWQKRLDEKCAEWERRFDGGADEYEAMDPAELFATDISDMIEEKDERSQSFTKKTICLLIGIFSYFASTVLMSIAATLFTLPIIMFFVGSVSILFLSANLVFVPISTVLLIAAPLVLFFGIPIIPAPISSLVYNTVEVISKAMILLPEKMASFASDITIVNIPELLVTFTSGVIVFIILRRIFSVGGRMYRIGPETTQRIISAVTLLTSMTALLFSSSLFGYVRYNRTSVSYFTSGSDEYILLRDGREDIFIDISEGYKSIVNGAIQGAENGLPDKVILTHVRKEHIYIYKTVFMQLCPKELYIPTPTNADESYLSDQLAALAKESSTDVIVYSPGQALNFSGYSFTLTEYTVPKDKTHPVICFDLTPLGEGESLSYVGGAWRSCAGVPGRITYPRISEPDHLIIGGHDPSAKSSIEYLMPNIKTALYGSEKVYELNKNAGGIDTERIAVYKEDEIGEYNFGLR